MVFAFRWVIKIRKYVNSQQVAAYLQYVFVPIDPNQADAETLQQLPGVDEQAPTALMDARPYANAAVFLERLASLVEVRDDDVSYLRAMLVGDEGEG